jgi:predicted dehydrogenase
MGKIRVLQESAEWELVGVAEPHTGWRSRRSGERGWQEVRWCSEGELLDDPTIRMIAVEADVPNLLPLAEKVIGAGKHLHLDKPAGADLAYFRRILDSAEKQGLVVQMGYMFRYNPGFDLLRRAVREGWLGRINVIHGSINSDIPAASREALAFHPGGMMLELCPHLIDMLVLLMGRPERITPFLRHDGTCDDSLADNTLAVMEYPQARAIIECFATEANAFARRRFEVIGDRGTFVLQPLEPPLA